MQKYLLLLLLLPLSNAIACCFGITKPFKSLDDLKEYDFIAHVKIINDYDSKIGQKEYISTDKLTIKILELYKGNPVTTIIETNKNSCVDIGIETGHEWVLFGRLENGKITLGACDFNVRYRKATGVRDWRHESGFKEIRKLRELFGIAEPKLRDGKHLEFYQNGRKELEETIQKGKRVGVRRIWYPNGVLLGKHHFVNDSLIDKSEWYFPTGQLAETAFFQTGKPVNVLTMYKDMSKLKIHLKHLSPDEARNKAIYIRDFKSNRKEVERIFDANGECIFNRIYFDNGQPDWDWIEDPETKRYVEIRYHINGIIRSITYGNTADYDQSSHQHFSENGMPEKIEPQ